MILANARLFPFHGVQVKASNDISHYPTSPILAFDDNLERLKLSQFAGQWTERYLKAFLQTGSNILVKLDPDTAVLRKARYFPDAEVFGVHCDGQVLGGCIGYSRDCARKIIDSGLLLGTKYTGLYYTYVKCGERVTRQDEIKAERPPTADPRRTPPGAPIFLISDPLSWIPASN
jgi:hypothetical protein